MISFRDDSVFMNARPFRIALLGLALFFYIYGVHFTFMPLSTARIVVLVAFAWFGIRLLQHPSVITERYNLLLLFVFTLFIFWVILVSAVNQLTDPSILASSILMVVHSFAGGLFFALMFRKGGMDFRQVILMMQVVITIQAVFILVYFISWDFREFTFAYIPATGNIDYRQNLFQSRGLTHSSGAMLSVMQAAGVLFTAYLLSTSRYRSREFIYLAGSFGLLVLSILMTGRTGILILPFVMIYFFLIFFTRRGIPKNILSFVMVLPLLLLISWVLFRFVYFNLTGGIATSAGEDIIDRIIRWYMTEFFEEGKLQSRTFIALGDHWFFPENLRTLLFGDPSTWSVSRIRSDIGYVRMWHGIGIIGSVLWYLLVLLIFIQMLLKTKGFAEKLLIISLGIFMFLIEFKEPFMFRVSVNALFLLLFCTTLITGRNDSTLKGQENEDTVRN